TDISDNRNTLVLDSADATGGDGEIIFTTENPSSTGAVGPMISSIHSGAACVLTGSTYDNPGRCVGGLSGDTPYLPFDMPTDGALEVQFNQTLNAATFILGSNCG